MTRPRATSRLARLLALVPYLVGHPGAPVAEVAEVFGITEKQLREDLDLLFVCGRPGYSPADLIDVAFEGDRVTVTNADPIDRPLRLTPDEALALVVAARSLAAEPGLAERGALDRAIAKLEAACAPDPAAQAVAVALEPEGEMLGLLEGALDKGRRVHIRYHTASRDEVTEREVDPMRLLNAGGRWYLEAWCRRVEDVRRFRLDRILDAAVLDTPAEVPPHARSREGLFTPDPAMPLVTLDVAAPARWVADYYPCESAEPLDDGGLRLTLRVGDPTWVRRLALRLGPHARVVEPRGLADEVVAAARAALAAYE